VTGETARGWVKAQPGTAITAAFVIGLPLGAVLGWWGPGRRSIDWGTAGEWAGALGTVGALWAALRLFRLESERRVDEVREREAELREREAERQERRRAQARLIFGEPAHPHVVVRNLSSEPVYNLKVASWEMDIGSYDVSEAFMVSPGEHHLQITKNPPEGAGVGVLQLRFGDASGVRWVREVNGQLREATEDERTRDAIVRYGL
jgi:hypothetical protein